MTHGLILSNADVYMTSNYTKRKIIGSVAKNSRVEILGKVEPFYRVRYNKCYIGFVLEECIKEV